MCVLYRLGEPVSLCWRLERSQSGSVSHDSNFIQYDVQASVSLLPPVILDAQPAGPDKLA